LGVNRDDVQDLAFQIVVDDNFHEGYIAKNICMNKIIFRKLLTIIKEILEDTMLNDVLPHVKLYEIVVYVGQNDGLFLLLIGFVSLEVNHSSIGCIDDGRGKSNGASRIISKTNYVLVLVKVSLSFKSH